MQMLLAPKPAQRWPRRGRGGEKEKQAGHRPDCGRAPAPRRAAIIGQSPAAVPSPAAMMSGTKNCVRIVRSMRGPWGP
jgi:hypothetical protein